MRLISCYVENFGNISGRTFDFVNLTSLCEKNGYGKTTLAAFIKAMFYGLPATRSSSKDRQRYYPFNGGKFGGSITLEKGGDIYRIERVFGKKSATDDECRVYKNNAAAGVPESVGKDIFGLDEASFMRTVFIDSRDAETGATSGISAKLNNFVDATDAENNYDSAMDMLVRTRKSYRAAKGNNDKISAVRGNIAALKSDIRNIEDISSNLGATYSEREEVAREIGGLENKLNAARETNLILQRWETYSSYLADAEEAKKSLKALEEKYPAGIPARDEIERLAASARAKQSAEVRLESVCFPEEKKLRLDALKARFRDGVPSEERIKEEFEKVAEITASEDLSDKFPAGVPEKSELEGCAQKLAELREKRSETVGVAAGAPQKGKGGLSLILAALAAALIVAGIAMLFVQMIAAIILIVAGLLSAGAFAYLKLKGARPAQSDAGYIKLQAEIAKLESAAQSFLVKYGYYTDEGAEVGFNNLTRDLDERAAYLKKAERRNALRGEVSSFLKAYGEADGDLQAGVLNLKSAVSEYIRLEEESGAARAAEDGLRGGLERSSAEISRILGKYGIAESGDLSALIKNTDADRAERDRLLKSVSELDGRARGYAEEYNLNEMPAGETVDTAELTQKLSALRTRRSDIDRAIDADEAVVERLQSKRNDLELEEEKLELYLKKHELLSKAIEALERAENNLKDKYVAPVRDKFLHYSEALEKALGEKIVMDADFKVRFERGGELREDLHLSAGQKSLCALCLRLALIDNMYGGEAPFVIMDDPFVHLDAEHMSRAKALLAALSGDMQIIYFCCHESRMI